MFSRLFRLLIVVGIFFVWYAASGIYIYAERTDDVSADAAVVLGAAVYNSRPSPVFRERINHGIALYHEGAVDHLIFTGGVGWRDRLSESEVARNYAIARGVPAEDIFIESQSTNTVENLYNVRAVSAENDIDTVIIVSTPFHMRRAMFIADRLGLDAYASPTRTTMWRQNGSRPWLVTREVVAYMVYRLSWQTLMP